MGCIILLLSSANVMATNSSEKVKKANYVLLKKTERKLYFYHDDEILKSYRVSLGRQPDGHKLRNGDSRTPEGVYTLDWRNPNSKYFRSIHISYPNLSDRRGAEERGDSPGGAIMIHGQPKSWAVRSRLLFHGNDWTEGCVAVQDHEMLEIWEMVDDGITIEILP